MPGSLPSRTGGGAESGQTGRYDLVISDVGMPVMSGHELMRALRELPHIKQVPAIALTGYGADSDIEESRNRDSIAI